MLYSVNGLIGFSVSASNGYIGKVVGFYFDDVDWEVVYLIVDIGAWLPGGKVILSNKALERLEFADRIFAVTLSKEVIDNSLSVNQNKPLSRGVKV